VREGKLTTNLTNTGVAMKKLIIAATVLLITTAGCSNDNSSKTGDSKIDGTPSKVDLLTGKTWKPTEATIEPAIDMNGDGTANTELVASGEIPACQMDDTETYDDDGTYITDEGPTKCNESEEQSKTNKWVFNADSTEIITNPGENETRVKILELTEDRLKGSTTIGSGEKSYTLTATFTKQ
jgi:hypothetical protein